MIRRRLAVLCLAALSATLAVGCSPGFVEQAARTSFAGFLVNVFSTAVNEAVTP